MRWWLGLAFAAVAGLTAVAVVAVLSNRSERAFRTYAQEFAVGNTVAATEALKRVELGRRASRRGGRARRRRRPRALRLRHEGPADDAAALAGDRLGERARTAARRSRRRSRGHRYIYGRSDGSAFVVGLEIHGGPGGAVVAYSLRPELREQLGIVRHEFLQSALLAFAVGAALGLLIASLIARRLARIARAAKAIGEGDFSVHTYDRFPDEVGSLAWSIERMRGQLAGAVPHARAGSRPARAAARPPERGRAPHRPRPARRVRERPRTRPARRRPSTSTSRRSRPTAWRRCSSSPATCSRRSCRATCG